MAQKFSLRPGTANHTRFGRACMNPKLGRFVVRRQLFAGRNLSAAKNGEIELVEWNAESARRRRSYQFPCKCDRLFLEVIAKGEVPQHFEESVVAVGEADVFEVVVFAAGAHAFLR